MPTTTVQVSHIDDVVHAQSSDYAGLQKFSNFDTGPNSPGGFASLAAIRFRSVGVPRGAVVTSAVLAIYQEAVSNTVLGQWHVVNSTNAPVVTNVSTTNGTRVTTNPQVIIASTGWKNYDFTIPIQALLNNGGWNSGQTLGFVSHNNGAVPGTTNAGYVRSTSYQSFDVPLANRPVLTIVWEYPTLNSLVASFDVGDNGKSGAAVYTVPSRTAGSTLALSGTDASQFSINSSTGVISLAANVSRAIGAQYNFTITETLAGSPNSPRASALTANVVEGYAGPVFKSVGNATITSGAAGITPTMPAWVAGDRLLWYVETANQAVTTPAALTEVAGSPQGTGTAAATTATRLSVYTREMVAGDTAPAFVDPGDHIASYVINVGPCDIAYTNGTVAATASTAVVFGVTTEKHTLVVAACAVVTDIATARFNSWTNLTEVADGATTQGNGGGIGIAVAQIMDESGLFDGSATLATSSQQARHTLTLKNKVAGAPPTRRSAARSSFWL